MRESDIHSGPVMNNGSYYLTLALVLLGTFFIGRTLNIQMPKVEVSFADAEWYQLSNADIPGQHLMLVFLGSPNCPWSTNPQLSSFLQDARTSVSATAANRKQEFETLGIALDRDPRLGWRFLEGFGGFDEVAVGRGWGNSLALKYLFGDLAGEPSTPQILIVQRTIDDTSGMLEVTNEAILRRLVGLSEIKRWIENPGYSSRVQKEDRRRS